MAKSSSKAPPTGFPEFAVRREGSCDLRRPEPAAFKKLLADLETALRRNLR